MSINAPVLVVDTNVDEVVNSASLDVCIRWRDSQITRLNIYVFRVLSLVKQACIHKNRITIDLHAYDCTQYSGSASCSMCHQRRTGEYKLFKRSPKHEINATTLHVED